LQKYEVKEVYAFDINKDLINCYNVIKSNVEFLIQKLYKKEKEYIKLEIDDRQAYFYNIRKDNLKLKEDFKEWRKN
jgi:DNA adenine methylase